MSNCCITAGDTEQKFIDKTIFHWAFTRTQNYYRDDDDCKDLAQELRIDLHRRLDRYDPAKAGRRTFIAMVVKNGFLTHIKQRKATRRGLRAPHVSWDQPLDRWGEGGPTLSDLISIDDSVQLTRGPASTQEQIRDLALDCERAIAQLEPLEQAACHLLSEISKAEAARELGIPRTTLQDVVRRVAVKLEVAGLMDYCK